MKKANEIKTVSKTKQDACSFYEEELLEKWMQILGLREWTIRLYTGCSSDDTGCSVASTEWDEVHKAAVIKVINPSQYGERLLPFNFEKTLVHELLHIKFALFDGYGDFQDRYLHQIIEEFAGILFAFGKTKGEKKCSR